MDRRAFLRLSGIGAAVALLAACSPTPAASPTAAPTAAPKPTTPPATAAPAAAPTAAPAVAATAKPAASGTQETWDQVLAAARREGAVAVAGPPGENYRDVLLGFEKAYPDIKVHYAGASGRDFAPKILSEREAGQFLWDIQVGGPTTAITTYKPKGLLDPIKPALIQPGVLDNSKWLGGFDDAYMDKERQYILGFQGYVTPTVYVNRDIVPESELGKLEQLLEPKWKGKFCWNEPRAAGKGSADTAHMLMVTNKEFLQGLLSQGGAVTSDLRQQVEWVVRGTYPIGIGLSPLFLSPFRKEGLGQNVVGLDFANEAAHRLGPEFGNVTLINRAAHPNAAKVYLNWLLSKEGQTVWVQGALQNSRRLDVEGPTESAPDPKKTYRIVEREDTQFYKDDAIAMAKELLK